MAKKYLGDCALCGRRVFGPQMAKYRGTIKACKSCRSEDEVDRSERRYFEKFSAEYQMEVQGYVSSP